MAVGLSSGARPTRQKAEPLERRASVRAHQTNFFPLGTNDSAAGRLRAGTHGLLMRDVMKSITRFDSAIPRLELLPRWLTTLVSTLLSEWNNDRGRR